MNSEELELSLRSEFDGHLKTVAAEMRQEFVQFQNKVEAEFDKHKSQLDAVFQEFAARLENEQELEDGFSETVVEHLRLARDEGARISATAFAEAEKMTAEMDAENAAAVVPVAGVAELSRAISDITAQDSQATILKSLVQHAAEFTPRGAFFIIKNEQFVGWRVFGKEGEADEQTVREILFPVASSTVLGDSVRALGAVESAYEAHSDDALYLNKLNFGQPERMHAIPLVARGRGVAVLYADNGANGETVNVEALQTLLRVAGLTVEVLAAAPAAKSAQSFQTVAPSAAEQSAPASIQEEHRETTEEASPVSAEQTEEFSAAETVDVETVNTETVADDYYAQPAATTTEYSAEPEEFAETAESFEEVEAVEEVEAIEEVEETEELEAIEVEAVETAEEFKAVEAVEEFETVDSWTPPNVEELEEVKAVEIEEDSPTYPAVISDADYSINEKSAGDFSFDQKPSTDYAINRDSEYQFTKPAEAFDAPVESPSASPVENAPFVPVERFPSKDNYGNGRTQTFEVETFEPVVSEPAVAAAAPPVRSRFSDRNVDLPIEVGEDERRLHNDARRFARLLVSEIKLYNEQKVKEGRESQDLYERLREAIDRSRDMYDKRVQPPVAAKFDYFHYELVSSLAEGEENRLGGSYPGSAI